jgi:ElaB/YqjD/DUF883 family membrane-anchored ribosome-binding protein
MARRKKAAQTRVKSLQDELSNMGAAVASLSDTLGDVASAEARNTINSIRARLNGLASEAGSATRSGVGMMQSTIEEKPFISVVAALAVGFILASMLRR